MKKIKIKENKNVSKHIKNGTMVMTRDEFFLDNNNYRKPQYINNNVLYRDAFVIETNKNDELILVKVQSGGKLTVINKIGQKEKYNAHLKRLDNEGKPIKLGDKFKRGNPKYDISEKEANIIKINPINHPNKNSRYKNKIELRKLKGRQKKKP